jgi:hypothetical protein
MQFYYKVEPTSRELKKLLSVFDFILSVSCMLRYASIFVVSPCPLRFASSFVVLSQLFVQLVAMGGIDPAVIVLDLLALFEPEFLGIKLDGVVVRYLDV